MRNDTTSTKIILYMESSNIVHINIINFRCQRPESNMSCASIVICRAGILSSIRRESANKLLDSFKREFIITVSAIRIL